jgi:predicted transcriptional regulator
LKQIFKKDAEKNMGIQKIILELKSLLATLTFDAAKKAEVEAKIATLEAEAAKQPAPAPAPTQKQPAEKETQTQVTLPPEVVTALSEVKTLKEMLLKQEQRAVDAEKAMKDRIVAEKAQKLADYIKKVTETENKITPAELKEKWQPLLEANFEATAKIIDAMKTNPASKPLVLGKDGKPVDQPKVGIMKSAPSAILAKIQEYSTANQN